MKKWLFFSLFSLIFLSAFTQTKTPQSAIKLIRVEKNYKDKSVGFITPSGDLKIPCTYEGIGNFNEGATWFYQNNKFGMVALNGDILLPAEYDFISNISSGCAIIKTGRKYGFVNSSGKIIVEPQYDGMRKFNEGLAAVKVDNKWGYINTTGKIVIAPKFETAYAFNEGFAKVILEKNKEYLDGGFINKTGQLVIPCKYYTGMDNLSDLNDGFYQGLARASIDGSNWGFINKTGKFVIKPIYSGASNFKEGLAAVWNNSTDRRMGYINSLGKEVVSFEYETGEKFCEGLAKVKIPEQSGWAYINKTGQIIIEPKYGVASDFANGYALVVGESGESFYIDKRGNFFHSYYSEDVVEDVTNMSFGNAGSYYTGKLKNGNIDGAGKLTNTDGSWYEGDYKNGLRNGIGTFRSSDGIRYYGNWVDDKAEGVFQVKQWTLGGLVSNEWYATYDKGNLVSSEQTKADFDNFLNNKRTSNTSSQTENATQTNSSGSTAKQVELVEIIIQRNGTACCAYITESYCFLIYEDGSKMGGEKTIHRNKNKEWYTDCDGVASGWKVCGNLSYSEALKKFYQKKYNKEPKNFKISEK